MTERDNIPAWTGRPGNYEVWFLTATDLATGEGYWIRSTLVAPKQGPPTGAVWFARFDPADPSRTFGIHRSYPFERVTLGSDEFRVSIAGTVFRSGLSDGGLEGNGHTARWEVRFDTGEPTYRLLPDLLYRGSAAPTRPYSPNVNTRFTGTIMVDGETRELEAAPGQQGHLYGRRHAERWAWAHCSDFVGEEAVLHALTAQGRRGPVTLPFLTSVGVLWEGRWIRLSGWSRQRPFGLGGWRMDLGNRRYRLSGKIEAPVRDIIRAEYHDPDGTRRYAHNSEISSCRLALFERRAGGFEEVALLESKGTTHAEWAGRTPATMVEHEHVEVAG